MSNYPIWWNSDVTLYNRYESNSGVVQWYRRKLTNCFWKTNLAQIIKDTGITETARTICRVPKSVDYYKKRSWDALSSENKQLKFTFSEGDILVLGDVTDSIDEYTSGSRSQDLIAKYKDDVMVICSFTDDSGVGRNNKHYYITGE